MREPVERTLFLVAQALSEAITAEQVTRTIFDHALSDLGATTVGLWMRSEDGGIRFSAGAGTGVQDVAPLVGDIPLDSDLPAALAIRTGQVLSYDSQAERDALWPQLKGLRSESAVVVLPLMTRDRTIGCLHIGWPERQARSSDHDLPLLAALADLCATAVDRSEIFDRERRARETLEFLHRGTRLMVSALEPDQILQALVRLAVPTIAPWCAVDVAEAGRLHRVAVSGAQALGALVGGDPTPTGADSPLAEVYRSGRMKVLPVVRAEEVVPAGEQWSGIVVPVEAGGEVIGVMSLLSPKWRGSPPAEVRFAAEGLAGRAGIALHNARLYRAQVDNVALLTSALLPDVLPELPDIRFAVRCVPASGGVCGDWYEAEVLASGRVLVGVGDVSGHGISAAASMAQMRNAARGLAAADMSPGEVLTHLNHLGLRGWAHALVTASYGLVDPGSGSVVLAGAGHPPPILAEPGRPARCIEIPSGPPLGVGDGRFRDVTASLPVGGRLVLYSDGLYERRGEDPDLGIGRLLDVIDRGAALGEDELAQALLDARPDRRDDGCVLVVGR